MADISIRQARKSYGKQEVVHGVDLDIAEGSFVVVLGPSGCGKSTLLRMIAGLEDITQGEIAIGGRVVNRLEPRERGCAMVFQNYALYPHMTVAGNIGYSLKVAGVSRASRRTKVEAVARTVGLTEFLDRKPGQLSGGQRQRVAMARAMIREPKVFLFDEPLSNLDAKLRVQMRLEIRRLHNRLGVTSVYVTHDQIEAMTLADRLVVMNKGHIEQVGTPTEVYRQPKSRFVADFIGAPPMNILPARVAAAGVLSIPGDGRIAFDARRHEVDIGDHVEVGIRPEDIDIADRTAGNTAIVRVELVEELGAGCLVNAFLGEHPIVISVPAAMRSAIDDTLAVRFASAHLHLFGVDGRCLDREAADTESDTVDLRPYAIANAR
jgi:sn-glycerol 3-phosphate transport system ATP-binding protein